MSTCTVIATDWPRRKWNRTVYPDSFAVPCLFGGLEILERNKGALLPRYEVKMPCAGESLYEERCLWLPSQHHPWPECSMVWVNPANLCVPPPEKDTPVTCLWCGGALESPTSPTMHPECTEARATRGRDPWTPMEMLRGCAYADPGEEDCEQEGCWRCQAAFDYQSAVERGDHSLDHLKHTARTK